MGARHSEWPAGGVARRAGAAGLRDLFPPLSRGGRWCPAAPVNTFRRQRVIHSGDSWAPPRPPGPAPHHPAPPPSWGPGAGPICPSLLPDFSPAECMDWAPLTAGAAGGALILLQEPPSRGPQRCGARGQTLVLSERRTPHSRTMPQDKGHSGGGQGTAGPDAGASVDTVAIPAFHRSPLDNKGSEPCGGPWTSLEGRRASGPLPRPVPGDLRGALWGPCSWKAIWGRTSEGGNFLRMIRKPYMARSTEMLGAAFMAQQWGWGAVRGGGWREPGAGWAASLL